MTTNTACIAKNTLMLYFRHILIILVSLYTVRVVLETLGAEDYGIYNVVVGVVTMLGFLSGSMASASQRYFSFELGRGDYEQLKRIFSLNLMIYAMIAIVVLLLAETIGLWFVNTKLILPRDRMDAVQWIYHCSIISFLVSIMATPYMSSLIAHEEMKIYASVSIVETLLKLGIVFLLKIIPLDKLQLYGILLCVVTIINTEIYREVCKRKFQECRFRLYWNKDLFKEIACYTGWNLFGSVSLAFKNQVINIILNQFFNPAVVAARGIASSINSAVASFSTNFSVALNPQIIKQYAAEQKTEMLRLMFRGTKVTYFLMYLFALPLIIEMPFVLAIWLGDPPEYTVLFSRLVLVDGIILSFSYQATAVIQATGKNKLHQIVQGGVFFLNFPISLLVLLLKAPAFSVMIISIGLTFIANITRLGMVKLFITFSIAQFIREVILPVAIVSILSMILPVIVFFLLEESPLRFCMIIGTCILSTCVFVYLIGFNVFERHTIKRILLRSIQTWLSIPRGVKYPLKDELKNS